MFSFQLLQLACNIQVLIVQDLDYVHVLVKRQRSSTINSTYTTLDEYSIIVS